MNDLFGGNINSQDDPKLHVHTRVGACCAILNRMHFFWKKSNCPIKFKLDVFDAVIRSKLVYSLEAVRLTPALLTKLKSVQMRGLRKILNLDHTFVNRRNTNAYVLQKANVFKNPQNRPNKNIRTFEEYVNEKQEVLLKHVVRESPSSPLREAMLKYKSPLPVEPHIRRVGRPKVSWVHNVYERIWKKSKQGSLQTCRQDKNAAIRLMEPLIQNKSI